MIRVLEDWNQIGEAHRMLARRGLPPHRDSAKTWDLSLLLGIVDPLPRSARIVDIGCSGLATLRFLDAMGFERLRGVDLVISRWDRLFQMLSAARSRTLPPRFPFHITRGDFVRSNLPSASFDAATCISVIEHGVDLDAFFAESHRILKRGGALFLTTDYWEEPIPTEPSLRPFGLPWNIFSRKEVDEMVGKAKAHGLTPRACAAVPPCRDRCISWNGKDYTFLCLVLENG